jgi:hypothetical protein
MRSVKRFGNSREETSMPNIIRPNINRRQWPRHEKKYLVQIATSLQSGFSLARDVKARVKWCVPSSTGGYAIGIQYEEPLLWTRYE